MRVEKVGFWSWFLQRITGLYLVFGMMVHLVVLPLSGKEITFKSVSQRLSNIWWLIFDISLLATCIYHGFNGIRSVILDYSPSPTADKFIEIGIALIGFLLFFYGIFVLVPFYNK